MTSHGPDRATLRSAVFLATRAPSVHNTQPWRWSIDAESVHLFADWTRQVPVTDPDGRDLVVSCGAALHHLRIALAASGWHSTVHRVPDLAEPHHLAAVELRPHVPTDRDVALASTISRRRTDRRRMSSWPVPVDHLATIAGRARHEGAICVAITDPGPRFHLAGAVAQAAVVQGDDHDYATETALLAGRGNGADEGVPALSHHSRGEPVPRRASLGTPARQAGKRYGQQAEYLVIGTSGDDVLSRLRAGEATSAALLGATELGLATCTLSRPMELADTRRVLRDDVLAGAAVPQLVVRVGWAPAGAGQLPRTPRRDVDRIITAPDA
jgi:nitroreductase